MGLHVEIIFITKINKREVKKEMPLGINPKEIRKWFRWLLTGSLLLVGLNILLNVFGMGTQLPLIGAILLPLGFFSAIGLLYIVKELEFKTLLDATLWFASVLLIGLTVLSPMLGVGQIISSNLLISAIFFGFQNFIYGFIIGGVIGGFWALVRMA